MENLVGVFVDNKYNIFVRKGDSGMVVIKNIPNENYKVSLGVVDPDTGNIIKEWFNFTGGESQTVIQIPVEDTESLGEGKFLYGIKLTLGENETTVIPNAYKTTGGFLSIPLPPTFTVLPKLVEG